MRNLHFLRKVSPVRLNDSHSGGLSGSAEWGRCGAQVLCRQIYETQFLQSLFVAHPSFSVLMVTT